MEWPLGQLDFSAGTLVMGILNITPDSFSDGSAWMDRSAALSHAVEMVRQGASIIDIGPESSRPGSERVIAAEQIRRAIPVIESLAGKAETAEVPISIDTYNPEVAAAAIDAGASIINDITALKDDRMAKLAADRGAAVVLMHMQGSPETMQTEPRYGDVTAEVLGFLLDRAKMAQTRGIPAERIFIDPGIGFGKTTAHNLKLLRDIGKFVESGYRVLVGASRKRFIGEIIGRAEPGDRVFGTAATVALCAAAGVDIVRVHDVGAMTDAVKIATAIHRI